MRYPRIVLGIGICGLFTFLLFQHPRVKANLPVRLPYFGEIKSTSDFDLGHIAGLSLAVVEVTSHHDEVIGAVLTVLHDLGVNATFHRAKWENGFEDVIKDIYPRPPSSIKDFEGKLRLDEVDVVVMTTCDAKFWHDWSRLHGLIVASSANVVCIAHEIELWHDEKIMVHLAPFAEARRLSMVTLAQHATDKIEKVLQDWALHYAVWATVPVADFVPIFSLPRGLRSAPAKHDIPSSAAILGRMLPWARRYEAILADLMVALADNPAAWGYRAVNPIKENAELVQYQPISVDAFRLYLIGKPDKTPLNIPSALLASEENGHSIVVLHENEDYTGFYRIIGSMDLVLPAFKKNLYYNQRASAAIPAALISRTPVLANDRLLVSYNYLAPPAFILLGEDDTEIDAIARLRREGMSTLRGSERDWQEYEEYLKVENMLTWIGILKPFKRITVEAVDLAPNP